MFSKCSGKHHFLCLLTLVFHVHSSSPRQTAFDVVWHTLFLIKNLLGEERSSLQTLRGDRLMTVTSIISSQALLTYRHGWRWQTRTMNDPNIGVWIKRTITALLLPINHTISRTGDWHDYLWLLDIKCFFLWHLVGSGVEDIYMSSQRAPDIHNMSSPNSLSAHFLSTLDRLLTDKGRKKKKSLTHVLKDVQTGIKKINFTIGLLLETLHSFA